MRHKHRGSHKEQGPASHKEVILLFCFYLCLVVCFVHFYCIQKGNRKTFAFILNSTHAHLVVGQYFQGCCPARVLQYERLAGENRGPFHEPKTDIKVLLHVQMQTRQREAKRKKAEAILLMIDFLSVGVRRTKSTGAGTH